MSECSRCGECCKYIARHIKGLDIEYISYLLQHGVEIEGEWALIPHVCQHLKTEVGEPCGFDDCGAPYLYKRGISTCDIHDSADRSELCKKFHGQKKGSKGVVFWVPKTCTMRD